MPGVPANIEIRSAITHRMADMEALAEGIDTHISPDADLSNREVYTILANKLHETYPTFGHILPVIADLLHWVHIYKKLKLVLRVSNDTNFLLRVLSDDRAQSIHAHSTSCRSDYRKRRSRRWCNYTRYRFR